MLTVLTGSLLFSCKEMKQPVAPSSINIPQKFDQDTSTGSVADLSIREYFKDPILLSLIDTALRNNPDVLIASQRIEMARAGFLQSRWSYLPFISVDGMGGVTKFGDHTMDGVGNFDTNKSNNITEDQRIPNPVPEYFLGIRSTWEIDIWGKLRNKKRAAYSRLLASEKGKHLIITSLVATVAEHYFTLMMLDQQLEIVRDNIELQQKVVETMSILKEGGRTNELAVRQAAGQLLNTQAMEFMIQQEIIYVENNLNYLLGRFPQPVNRGKSYDLSFFPEKIEAGIPADFLFRRPDIQQAEKELKASEYEVKSARAAFLPSLVLTGFGAYNSFDFSFLTKLGSLAYGVLGGVSAPVLQGKRIKANHRFAMAANYEAYHTYQKSIYRGFSEVNTNLSRIRNYQKIVELKNSEVKVLREAVSSANALFRSGYASYLEVIMMQKNVLDAELGLINAKREQYFALIDLYRSLGGGWQ